MKVGKVRIAHEHFLDFSRFKVLTPLESRDKLVGYVGRLVEGKGILELLIAFLWLANLKNDIDFIVIGDGPVKWGIEAYIKGTSLEGRIELTRWIKHDDLPFYYNRMKLLVLPSYTEALPNVILEAMACGTPVLATAVGAIPDYIKHGETGFLLDDNSPTCIFGNILAILENPQLQSIADRARQMVEKEFTFEMAVESYKKALLGGH